MSASIHSLAPQGPASSTASMASRIQRVRAACGVEAWLVEDYTVPLLAMDFAFKGGAAQDAEGRAGSANLLSGLLEEGAGQLDNIAFQSRIEDLALEMHFHAGKDAFAGSLKTLIKHRDAAFDMLRLALNEAHLDQDALDRLRSQVIAGMKFEENDPNEIASKTWYKTAFKGHAYGRQSQGDYESVRAITRDDLLALRARLFARSHLKIAVVGAIDAATLSSALDHVFAGLPEAARLVSVPMVEPQALGTREVIELDVPQSVIKFGASGPLRNTDEFIPAFVVNHVLGGGVFSARLFKEVREKRGLAYSVYSTLAPSVATGLFYGATATKNERAGESLKVIEDEIADLAAKGPTAGELDVAKKYLTGSYALRFDSSSKIASQLVQIQFDELGIDYIDRRNALVEAVDLDVARAAAARLLGGGKMLVTVVGKPEGL